MRWYFRLATGQWGYVEAVSRKAAFVAVRKEHGVLPVHVERY